MQTAFGIKLCCRETNLYGDNGEWSQTVQRSVLDGTH
jgi:hypothetical protein